MSVWSLGDSVWIGLVLAAALAQTARNTAQRHLTGVVGTLPATWVRFLYGLPFAALAVLVLRQTLPAAVAPLYPTVDLRLAGWLATGAIGQLLATAFMLAAMHERNFVVGVAYSKTDVLQVALFGTLFLGERPGWMAAIGMGVATLGVMFMSLPPGGKSGTKGAWMGRAVLSSRAAWLGLASGAGFAFSAVGYRGAALAMQGLNPGMSPWLIGAWGVLLAQTLQSLLLGAWLGWHQRTAFLAVARAWRLSLLAGTTGALASLGWFSAFAMRAAADVRAVGLVEVVFSLLVSRRLLRERLSAGEWAGLAGLTLGLVFVLAST